MKISGLPFLGVALFMIRCGVTDVHRVSVAYPADWRAGDRRNCIVDGIKDVINGLPELDCDTGASDTPRSRIFVMDVKFSGKFVGKGDHWTCERADGSLVCIR